MRRMLHDTDLSRCPHNSDWSAPAATTRSDWPAEARLTPPPTLQLSDWPDPA